MPNPKAKKQRFLTFFTSLFFINLILLSVTGYFVFAMYSLPKEIRASYKNFQTLHERLIIDQITSHQLNQVHILIKRNLAYTSRDSLDKGKSLIFLNDLAKVLDKLKIHLLALKPLPPIVKNNNIETPYQMEIQCTYEQFLQLVNKMEKSPRLISIKEFEIFNRIQDYVNPNKKIISESRIKLMVTTLTLMKVN